jgi:hypothetical protein
VDFNAGGTGRRHTIGLQTVSLAINRRAVKTPYDTPKDLAPIDGATSQHVLVVKPPQQHQGAVVTLKACASSAHIRFCRSGSDFHISGRELACVAPRTLVRHSVPAET